MNYTKIGADRQCTDITEFDLEQGVYLVKAHGSQSPSSDLLDLGIALSIFKEKNEGLEVAQIVVSGAEMLVLTKPK